MRRSWNFCPACADDSALDVRLQAKIWATAEFLLAGILYSARSATYWVGAKNDDAQYVLLAQSILHGTYRSLQTPGSPHFTTYPPGFPIFLVPFVAVAGAHCAWLKIIPIVLTLVSGIGFWYLLRTWLPSWARLLGLAFLLFNPFVVLQSALVMSDSLFLLIIVASYLELKRVVDHPEVRHAMLLGLLLGWAALVRSVGFVLIPVFAGALIFGQRHRAAAIVAALATLLGGSFPLANLRLTAAATGYGWEWASSFRELFMNHRVMDHLNRVTNLFFVSGFLAIPLPYSPGGILASTLLTILLGLVVYAAFWGHGKRPETSRLLLFTLLTTVAAFFVLHCFWAAIDIRFVTPVIPPLAALVAIGGQGLADQRPKSRMRWILAGAALGVVLIFRSGVAVAHSRSVYRQSDGVLPVETWNWIRNTLPADARLLNPLDAQVYLYTQRQCVSVLAARDSEEYRYLLMREGVTHILARPCDIHKPGLDVNKLWFLNQRWAAADPKVYRRLFQSQLEATAIYQVAISPDYLNAYTQFMAARTQLMNGQTDAGLRGLEAALKLEPHLTAALNAYGVGCLLRGRDLQKARNRLEDAVAYAPHHVLAWLNLGRVCRAMGDQRGARDAFRRAQQSLADSPEWEDLRPIIDAEFRHTELHT